MKMLFTMDQKDYDPNWEKFYRPSVRGIILNKDGEIAMIYSRKYHYYKFPGGGIEDGESHLDALAREIKEETGMVLIPESVQEFGEVMRIHKNKSKDEIFVQQNFYYTCGVQDEIGDQNLDEFELDADFVLQFVPIEEAIKTNAAFKNGDSMKEQMVEREKRVLETIKDTVK